MGYYVKIEEVDWEITDNSRSLQVIRDMPRKFHAIKRGGSSNGEKWFSWMNNSTIEEAKSVQDVFNELGFETEKTDKGFRILAYNSKTGQEDLFLAVMAPWTTPDSYIKWSGEDGAMWLHSIEHNRMMVQEADITWKNKEKYTYRHFHISPSTNGGLGIGATSVIDIDPFSNTVDEELKRIDELNQKVQAHYAEIRQKAQEAREEEETAV